MQKKRLLILIVIVLLIGAGVGSILMVRNQQKTEDPRTGGSSSAKLPEDKYPDIIITVSDDGFNPTQVKIKPGTRVVWVNKSTKTATVNSDDHSTHAKYKDLNLGAFETGKSVQLKFETIGNYSYHNHLLPEQKGEIVVE